MQRVRMECPHPLWRAPPCDLERGGMRASWSQQLPPCPPSYSRHVMSPSTNSQVTIVIVYHLGRKSKYFAPLLGPNSGSRLQRRQRRSDDHPGLSPGVLPPPLPLCLPGGHGQPRPGPGQPLGLRPHLRPLPHQRLQPQGTEVRGEYYLSVLSPLRLHFSDMLTCSWAWRCLSP